jgi:predicted alpha/beta hydrolase family esterase
LQPRKVAAAELSRHTEMTTLDIGHPVIVVPGLGGSDPHHWRSVFEDEIPGATRLSGIDWHQPKLSAWIDALIRATRRNPEGLLVAHSLGCALVAHAIEHYPDLLVRGALLVAPADIDASPAVPASLDSFAGVPRRTLPFPSVLIASRNDPYMTPERARLFASAWGSTLFDAGTCGHINVASGFGPWPQGLQILRDFAREIETTPTSASSHRKTTERT